MAYIPNSRINGSNFTEVIHNDTYPTIDPAKGDHLGRAVFITGASGGIGLATANSFALAGASYIALSSVEPFPDDINQTLVKAAKSVNRLAPKILTLHLDLLDEASIQSAATKVKDSFGKLDILINNAGYMAIPAPISSLEDSTYWRTFEINLRGTYRVTKAFLPLLLSSTSSLKTIVNLNSVAAHNIRLEASAYGTSKFAVLRFTEFLVEENRGSGLIAFCVHPGAIMTRLAEAMPRDTHAMLTDKPALAGDTIAFLTQGRRDWLAGRYISCQWDMEELMARKEEILEGNKLKMRMAF